KPPAMFFATDDHVKWIAAFLRQGLAPFVESRCPQCGGVLKEYSCKDAEGVVGHAGCRSRASSMRGRKPAALAMLKYWAVHEADPINDAHSEIARRLSC
ncbi:MAG: hypothetical protein QXR18_07135, partial [Pyrobaculum sp.]